MSEADQRETVSVPELFSESAFDKLHDETFPALWSFARRICGDESEAHDVCQKAYVAVWGYWREGRLREHPRRVLYRAAENAALDAIRSRKRRARLAQALPRADTSAQWLGVDLRDALARLNPEDRALVLLQAAVGLTYEELAAVERRSVAAVRSRLHRARVQLRRALRASA